MSFVEQEDVLSLTESLMIKLVQEVFPKKHILKIPFPRISYEEAQQKYQTDRPDLRVHSKDSQELAFAFVLDFPMFERQESRQGWAAVHHPFTRPQTDSVEEIKKNPGKIKAFQYDLVLNGQEVGGGSLRSFKAEILEAVFEVLGHTKEEIEEQFGHLLNAFQYGAPPHGGIALGLDRLLAVLLEERSIREVIAFPKTGDGRSLMMGTPAKVSQAQLKELYLQVNKPKKTNERSNET